MCNFMNNELVVINHWLSQREVPWSIQTSMEKDQNFRDLESKSGISISLGKIKLLCDIEQPPPPPQKKEQEQ